MSDPTVAYPPYHESPTYRSVATEADIRACYRLLLGRQPDPGGLQGFLKILAAREASVFEVVKTFMTSAEFGAIHQPSFKAQAEVVELDDFRMWVKRDDMSAGQSLAEHRVYEPHVTAVFRRMLRPGMHVLDIGANVGFFTMLAASMVGSEGRVVSFEPGQNNVALIHASAELNGFTPRLDLWPLALSDHHGMLVLTQQGSNGFVRELDGYTETLDHTSIIRCVALDQFRSFERLDFVKIDIEGGEGRAISGARQTIRRFRPLVCSEFSPPMLQRQSGMSGESYLKLWLEDRYELGVIEPDGGIMNAGTNADQVMTYFEKHASTHIDLLLSPV